MPEVLKRIDIDDILLKFSNKLLVENDLPDQLAVMNIIPVPKKGDLSMTSNYRGIALTSLISKLINPKPYSPCNRTTAAWKPKWISSGKIYHHSSPCTAKDH